ncbi:MAG: hypothetical protein P4L43_06805 [Syntrophobacteraceae bacterium]|nr:hypothetical protein [Syntrophobacteraceae bacterium]
MKRLTFVLFLALFAIFFTVSANAHPRCGKVYVPAHRVHHRWVPAHYVHRHWVPAHRVHHRIVPGHCA